MDQFFFHIIIGIKIEIIVRKRYVYVIFDALQCTYMFHNSFIININKRGTVKHSLLFIFSNVFSNLMLKFLTNILTKSIATKV